MKRIVSLLLALCMLLSVCAFAAAEEETKYPISEGTYPIVPEGETVTIKIGVTKHDSMGGDPEKLWLWNYLSKLMNIKFEFVSVLQGALTERKNLMFAGNELPDVLIGFNLSTSELLTYGQMDKQLLPLNDYLNDEYMPNLMQWMAAKPYLKDIMTCLDGNVYSLPRIGEVCGAQNPNSVGTVSALFINDTWMKENNKEYPKTVDEMTELMRAYKAQNPDSYPFACSANANQGFGMILNALGYVTSADNIYGYNVTLRNGEVVIPCYDEVFKNYLEILHTWYQEELISPDYFTLENTGVAAMVSEGKALFFNGHPYTANASYEVFNQWKGLTPLTSEWNDTPIAKTTVSDKLGGFVVSAKAERPDVIMKMADWFYSALGGFYQWYGPAADDEEMKMGMEGVMGWVVNDEGVGSFVSVNEGIDGSNAAYLLGHIQSNWVAFGNNTGWLGREDEGLTDQASIRQYLAGKKPTGFSLDPTVGYANAVKTLIEDAHLYDYLHEDYPAYIYVDEDTNLIMNDLHSVLDNYVQQEVAKFITGRRSLDEFDAFENELKNLNVEELLGYYQTAYQGK